MVTERGGTLWCAVENFVASFHLTLRRDQVGSHMWAASLWLQGSCNLTLRPDPRRALTCGLRVSVVRMAAKVGTCLHLKDCLKNLTETQCRLQKSL